MSDSVPPLLERPRFFFNSTLTSLRKLKKGETEVKFCKDIYIFLRVKTT